MLQGQTTVIKKFVILLACISTLFMGFVFLVSPYNSSVAIKRKTATILYDYGFDQAAGKVWQFAAWAGDKGAEANLALLNYKVSYLKLLRDEDPEEGAWQKSYELVDQILNSMSTEKDIHEFNRAMLRLTWPSNAEWKKSAVNRLRAAESHGSDLAKMALIAFDQSSDHLAVFRTLADNGDATAAYYYADEMALEHENTVFPKYRDIALTGTGKYFPGYELFTRRLYNFDSKKIEMFEKYSIKGYIYADINLFEMYNEKYFEICEYKNRRNCEVDIQKKMNETLRRIIRHDCTSGYAKGQIGKSGLIILNVDDGKIINSCKRHLQIAAVQLALRLYLGLGGEQNYAEAKSILQMKSLLKMPYAQMVLGQIDNEQSKVFDENSKLDGIFIFHTDGGNELRRLVKTGSIRLVTFFDFHKWASNFNEEDVAGLWQMNKGFHHDLGMTWIAEDMETNVENILGKTGVSYIVEDSPEIQSISAKWPGRLIILRHAAK
jgi:hypothetical protein